MIPRIQPLTPIRYGRLQKSLLIQMAEGEHEVLLNLVRDHHQRYAKRHGLDYWCITGNPMAEKRAGWGKIPLLLAGIALGYECVVWLDADAIVIEMDTNLATLAPGGIAMVRHPNPEHWNTGLIISRATAATERFWREVDISPENNSSWMEQLAVNELACRSDFAPLFHSLDLAWNSVPGIAMAENPAVIAAHGLPHQARQAILFQALQACKLRQGNEALPGIERREEFGDLLNQLGLVGDAVEVGVLRGEFAEILLERWQGRMLHLVDPWRQLPGYVDIANVGDAEHEANYAATRARLAPHQNRYRLVRDLSENAAAQFANGSLDFVYLDADHSFQAVWLDLQLWYPKLKPGGILAGHDFLDGNLPEGCFGVASAVHMFEQKTGLRAQQTGSRWPSWYLRKPT